MGDMADMIIEDLILYEAEEEYYESHDLSCKFCGEKGFHWAYDGRHWRLYDHNEKLHNCPHYTAPTNRRHQPTMGDDILDPPAPGDATYYPKTCMFCGGQNLHWEEHGDGWRLYDENDELHECHPDYMEI